MCHVMVDATKIPCFSFTTPLGPPCFAQACEVVYICGKAEFKVQLRWMEGVRCIFRPFRWCDHSDEFSQDEKQWYFSSIRRVSAVLTPLQQPCHDII